MSEYQDAQITRLTVALRELLEATDHIKYIVWNRDIAAYKEDAIWESAVEQAKRTLKETT